MIKLNTLKFGDPRVIGQLYINGNPTNEIIIVQYGKVLSISGDRSWTDAAHADDKFSVEHRPITIHDVVTIETKDLFLL